MEKVRKSSHRDSRLAPIEGVSIIERSVYASHFASSQKFYMNVLERLNSFTKSSDSKIALDVTDSHCLANIKRSH